MARFKLKPGVEEKELGKIINEMAEDATLRGYRLGKATLADYEERIRGLLRPQDNLAIKEISFVFDTPEKINFVVPDLGRKRKKKPSKNDQANEIMGLVVIRGCGK